MSENNKPVEAQAQEAAEPEIHLTLTPAELEEENAKQLQALEAKEEAKKAQKAAVEIVDGALACDVYDWLMREDWEIAESEEQ